jgi:hypothetical protein
MRWYSVGGAAADVAATAGTVAPRLQAAEIRMAANALVGLNMIPSFHGIEKWWTVEVDAA